jgi:hypothetical protein
MENLQKLLVNYLEKNFEIAGDFSELEFTEVED